MKRYLAVVLLIGLLAGSLIGCNQNDADASSTNDTTVATTDTSNDAATEPASVEDTAPVSEPESTDGANTDGEASANAATSRTRGPITILGNADFTEANGVLGGTGTEDDPYVLAGWEIVVPSGSHYGVRIENVSAQFVLRGLIIQNATELNGAGIRVGFADGGTIEGCSIANSMNGIDIVSSTDISVDTCVLYVNGRGLRVVGETQEQYRHAIADTNLYNNHPIYYFYGLDGETISELKGGHLTVAGSRNMTIRNNEVVNGDGIHLAFVDDSTMTLNVAHRTANVITEHGIQLYESHNNVLETNLVKNNRLAGIQLTLSHDNRLVNNQVLVNDIGVRLLASQDNTVEGNMVYANTTGILVLGGSTGNIVRANSVIDEHENMVHAISLETAMDNEISKNLIFGSEMGLALDANARRNVLKENTIVGGGYGIYVEGSDNTFEDNLLTQHSRGILFPETFQRTTTQGNLFRGNVLADNGMSHVYTNMDSTANQFTKNVFLNDGRDAIVDQGTNNIWSVEGVGNHWALPRVPDMNGDGIGDRSIPIYPSEMEDAAPLIGLDARAIGLGVLGTLELELVTLQPKRGDEVQVPAFLADEPVERATGFRGFPTELITGFPGILFIFDEEQDETVAGFTMDTVPFDLDIAFFNAEGEFVGGTTMTALEPNLYLASAAYRYALELPSGTLDELGIGANSKLVLP